MWSLSLLLVQLLQPRSLTGLHPLVAGGAAGVLQGLTLPLSSAYAENVVTIATAGAIPRLVLMLGRGFPAQAQQSAAGALMHLTSNADNLDAIAAAGGIRPLVQLVLAPGSSELTKSHAARALKALGDGNASNCAAMAGAVGCVLQ
jgi:hypothetical protein